MKVTSHLFEAPPAAGSTYISGRVPSRQRTPKSGNSTRVNSLTSDAERGAGGVGWGTWLGRATQRRLFDQ